MFYDPRSIEPVRAALDCDVLSSCVDRPWPRFALNLIAYAHLIPVVDGGIRIEVTRQQRLKAADLRAHVAAPGRPCLLCLGQYDPALVSDERAGLLDDPKYIQGLSVSHPLRRGENVFAFSTATAAYELLQMLMMVVAPMGIASPGAQFYHFVPGLLDQPLFEPCTHTCAFPSLVARGDHSGFSACGRHERAEAIRLERQKAQEALPWRIRVAGRAQNLSDWVGKRLVGP